MEYLLTSKAVEFPSPTYATRLLAVIMQEVKRTLGLVATRGLRTTAMVAACAGALLEKKVTICCTLSFRNNYPSASWFPWAPGQKERVEPDEAVRLWGKCWANCTSGW